MNIIEAFDNLNKLTGKLKWVYWEISDNYRGPNDFDVGLSQFIWTIEGRKLEKELSKLTKKVNSSIDKIIGKIGRIAIIKKENIKKVNELITDFANNFMSINGKNRWFNERHNIDINELAKLNKYFEKFISKVRLLEKAIKEKRDVLNIITIQEAMDNINKSFAEELNEILYGAEEAQKALENIFEALNEYKIIFIDIMYLGGFISMKKIKESVYTEFKSKLEHCLEAVDNRIGLFLHSLGIDLDYNLNPY